MFEAAVIARTFIESFQPDAQYSLEASTKKETALRKRKCGLPSAKRNLSPHDRIGDDDITSGRPWREFHLSTAGSHRPGAQQIPSAAVDLLIDVDRRGAPTVINEVRC